MMRRDRAQQLSEWLANKLAQIVAILTQSCQPANIHASLSNPKYDVPALAPGSLVPLLLATNDAMQ